MRENGRDVVDAMICTDVRFVDDMIQTPLFLSLGRTPRSDALKKLPFSMGVFPTENLAYYTAEIANKL